MSSYDYTDSSDDNDDGSDSDSDSDSSLHSADVSVDRDNANIDMFGREIRRSKDHSPLAVQKKGPDTSKLSIIPSSAQKRYLTQKLHTLDADRKSITALMFWFIKHSHFACYLFDFLISSIISSTCAIHLKLNRLYLLSDILFNSQCGFTNAWQYRSLVDLNGGGRLECIVDHFATVWKGLGRVRAEGLRKNVLGLLGIWECWGIFTIEYIESLRQRFTRVIEKPNSFQTLLSQSNDTSIVSETLVSSSSIADDNSSSSKGASGINIQTYSGRISKLPLKSALPTKNVVSRFKPIDSSVPSGFVPIETLLLKNETKSIGNKNTNALEGPAEKKLKINEGIPVSSFKIGPLRKGAIVEDEEEEEEDVLEKRTMSKIIPKPSDDVIESSQLYLLPKKTSLQMKFTLKSDQARFEGERELNPTSEPSVAPSFLNNTPALLLPTSQKKKRAGFVGSSSAPIPEQDTQNVDEEAVVHEWWAIDDSELLEPNPDIDGEELENSDVELE